MSEPQLAIALHHVNFAISDAAQTYEWYKKVFDMEHIDVSRWTPETTTLLMTSPDGRFHIHFNTTKDVVLSEFFHFAVEVSDWDRFIERIEGLGLEYGNVRERPQDHSKTLQMHDPDGILVEVTYHEKY